MAREHAVGAPLIPRDGGTVTETGGDDAPARAGYVDDAIRRMRVAAAAAGRGGAPGAAGTADAEVLRTALATLPPDDQRLLWATHVQRQEPSAVAAALGTHPRAAARLLPQAEQALATVLADAHARGCPPGCAGTREALHDLVRGRVPSGRATELEDHLLDCAACLRAFVDVREPAWALRDAGPRLLAGGWRPPAVVGAAAAEAPGGTESAAAPRPARRQSWLIVAGTVACVAVAGVAIALGSGDAAPAAPGQGSSEGATSVGTVPDDASSPAASPSSVARGDDGPSARPTASTDPSATPSGDPSPTASPDDDASSGPSTSPTSSPDRDDEPTTSPTSTGSTSSKPTSRPTPTTTPTDEDPPTGTATPTEEPTDEPTDETPTEPTDPEPSEPTPTVSTDPDPVETTPTEPPE